VCNLRLVRMAFCLLMTSALCSAADALAPIDLARTYLSNLRAEQYAACLAASDDTLRSALPAEKLSAVWHQVTTAYGAFEAERAVSLTQVGENHLVDFTCKFTRGVLRVRISVTADGKITGLFFTPIPEATKYTPPEYADSGRFREEPLTVDAGGWPLPGTLTLPRGEGPFPAVVLVHGSGPHDQDETIEQFKPFKDLAWGLATRGIAVLRYEKRTLKYGARIDPGTLTVDAEVADDAVAAANQVSAHGAVDSAQVFLLGHSLGASAAPFIGLREPRLAGIVLIAPPARPIHELVVDQVTYLAQIDGAIDGAEQEQIDALRAVVERLRAGQSQPGDALLGAPVAYWRELDKLSPLDNARAYTRPMLLIFGGRDYQITAKDERLWREALTGREHVEIQNFARMDHLMHAGDGPSKPGDYSQPGHVDVQVVDRIADWIKARTPKR